MFCFASSFLFSKRLVLVFLLHSFPSISFPLFFLFFFLGGDLELGAGVLVFIF